MFPDPISGTTKVIDRSSLPKQLWFISGSGVSSGLELTTSTPFVSPEPILEKRNGLQAMEVLLTVKCMGD